MEIGHAGQNARGKKMESESRREGREQARVSEGAISKPLFDSVGDGFSRCPNRPDCSGSTIPA